MTSWAVIPMVLCFAMNAAAQPAASKAPQRQTYQSADVDADGNLRIITSDHRTIIVPKAKDQTSFERVAISSDHAAVGALEDYKNCCASWDTPQRLVVYANGKTHRFAGDPGIFDWHFVDGGRRVAFGETAAHGTCVAFWHLRQIEPERVVASATDTTHCEKDSEQVSHLDSEQLSHPSWIDGATSGLK
jgi:hypothetical protein